MARRLSSMLRGCSGIVSLHFRKYGIHPLKKHAYVRVNLQQRLSESLFTYSNSRENLIMTPKPYTDLQTELQFCTDELEAAVKQLEKVNLKDRVDI